MKIMFKWSNIYPFSDEPTSVATKEKDVQNIDYL